MIYATRIHSFNSFVRTPYAYSTPEIDEQLFDKYGLDEQERNFIRTKVKEMA